MGMKKILAIVLAFMCLPLISCGPPKKPDDILAKVRAIGSEATPDEVVQSVGKPDDTLKNGNVTVLSYTDGPMNSIMLRFKNDNYEGAIVRWHGVDEILRG